MQRQLIATANAFAEQTTEISVLTECIPAMKVGHHQPGHGHVAQLVDRFDEGPIIRPRRGRNVV